MSRSYKKNYTSSMCSSRGDKYCRNAYHRAFRRKQKYILDRISKEGQNYELEDLCLTKDYDRGLRFADRWAWASDGGSYFSGDLSTLRKEFDTEVFKKDIWENYLSKKKNVYEIKPRIWKVKLIYETYYKVLTFPCSKERIEFPNDNWIEYKIWRVRNRSREQFYDEELLGFLFKRNIIPKDFDNSEELINWLKKNQETILRKWYKNRRWK